MSFINRKRIGNTLIIISIIGFIWIYAPLVPYFSKSSSSNVSSEYSGDDSIEIPKINAYANLSFNVDPWNSASYEKALENGVAHAKGTALPGESGTSYLFAHSSLPFWRMTHTNTPFLFLGNLANDDIIRIRRNGVLYVYKVIGKKEVWPNEVSYLVNETPSVSLILQTCTPIGTALKRLLVFAIRVV